MANANRLPVGAAGIFLLAAVVGGLGGLGGVAFRELLVGIQELLMGQGGSIVEAGRQMSWERKLLVPALGGLAAGVLLWLIGRRPTPFGISDVMDLVGRRRSDIPPLRSLVQIASSACSLASGGSLGREGAITQIGTTLPSVLTGVFRERCRNRVILLACGTAAGMASSYNAPLAGAIFVMEVILGSFAMEVFAPLVVASVSSAVVTEQAGARRPRGRRDRHLLPAGLRQRPGGDPARDPAGRPAADAVGDPGAQGGRHRPDPRCSSSAPTPASRRSGPRSGPRRLTSGRSGSPRARG